MRKRAIKENRFDDANEETIRRRLETYEEESKPLLDYYGKDLVVSIDATQSPIKVFFEIAKTILEEGFGSMPE